MATEYKLSYTAEEIDSRLGKVTKLSEDTEKLTVDIQNKAEVVALTTAEYDALNEAGNIDTKTLYTLTDVDEEQNAEIELDTTLSVEGKAADAKAVGDALVNHEHSWNDLTDKPDIPSIEGLATEEYVNTQIANIPTSGGSGANAIIDVTSLPADNINKNSWYRLVTGKFVYNQYEEDDWRVICADGLPEVGEPVSTDMANVTAYCNMQDGEVYAYVNDLVSSASGAPVGWYPLSTLAPAFDLTFNGVISDIDDDPCDDSFRILLKYDFYMYQDGWCQLPFACEKAPKFDITWDGDMTGKFTLDMSALGFDGISITKVSDIVLTTDQLIGSTYYYSNSTGEFVDILDESNIDTSAYPGGITVNNGEMVIVYSADEANAGLGLPAGYLTNGLYFYYRTASNGYISRLVAPSKVMKFDSKFLGMDIDMSNIYTKSEVETLIANAIGGAIGGSY